MPRGRIRVLLAVGEGLLREGLVALLEGSDDLETEGPAGTGSEVLELAGSRSPDVTLLDATAPEDGVLVLLEELRRLPSPAPVVTLADGPDRGGMLLEAGAAAWLDPRRASFGELAETVRRAAAGLAPEGPEVAGFQAPRTMTPRERQVAVLLADGYTTPEAARVLGISVRTAETHRAAIMRKLNARNVADVVKYCIRSRLIDL